MSKEILNKYIELIDKGYCDDCNELNCLGNFPHKEIAKNIKDILEENQELKNQQKEFIEYLEDKLNMCNGFLDTIKSDLKEISYAGRISGKNYIATQIMKNETAKKNYEDILSKYKEIIGGDNK